MDQLLANIRKIRKSKGISQEAMAYDLSMDYSTYGKIERGVIELSVSRLEKIVKILGVPLGEVYPEVNKPVLSSEITVIIEGRIFKAIELK
jgi:transcriptional regulator with XRE-family HTH domain